MKTTYILSLIASLLIISSKAYTQTPENRLWTSTSFDITATSEHVSHACSFETHPDKIKWIQKGGTRVTEFEITSKTNSWNDIQATGEITYQVTLDGNTGSIRFYREAEQLFIETQLLVDGKNTLPYRFTVNSTSAL